MAVRMGVAVSVIVTVGGRRNHSTMLYYNITRVHRREPSVVGQFDVANFPEWKTTKSESILSASTTRWSGLGRSHNHAGREPSAVNKNNLYAIGIANRDLNVGLVIDFAAGICRITLNKNAAHGIEFWQPGALIQKMDIVDNRAVQ